MNALRELRAELSKLSANPVFNPKIYTLGLKLGFTYIKDGYNTAKKWLAKMHQTFGDDIKPWAPAIIETIKSYPLGAPFNEKTVSMATKIVGSMYESGKTDLNEIQSTITKKMSEEQKKVFADGENTRRAESSRERTGGKQSENDSVGDSERGRKQSSAVEKAKETVNNQPAGNYEITKSAEGKTGEATRYQQNIEAIKLLKQLESESRMPTPREQDVLAAYNGWGGLKSAFLDDKKNNELKELLTEEEYEAIRATINDAYTSPSTIRAIWKGVSLLGFKGGRVLDPSMGIGNFFGCMPRDMMDKSSLHGIEIDDLTSRFAKKLYPNANIEYKGFQHS